MPQNITELTTLSPSPSNYILHRHYIDGKHLFSLRSKGKNADPHFNFKPLEAISINDEVFTDPVDLVTAFNENFNGGGTAPTLSIRVNELPITKINYKAIYVLPDGSWNVYDKISSSWIQLPLVKTSYQYATENGYTGTEQEFADMLLSIKDKQDKIEIGDPKVSLLDLYNLGKL